MQRPSIHRQRSSSKLTPPAARERARAARPKRRTILRGSIAALAAVSLSFGAASKASAVDSTWINTLAGVYAWNDGANWNTNPLFPNAISDTALLNLNIAGNQTIDLTIPITVGTITIGDTIGQSSFIIAPGAGALILNDSAGDSIATITKVGIGTDVFTTNIAVAAANTLAIDVTDGIFAQTGILSGAGGLTKTGDGTLILRGTNTYTGVTTLSGGTTLLAGLANTSAALGASTAGNGTVVNSGATLALGPINGGAGGGNFADPITINGDGFRNNGALRSFMGINTNTYSGAITMGSAARIQADLAGTFTLSGALNVSSTLTTGGVGFVSYTGAVSGTSDINHYGISGFRMQNVTAGQTYTGTINSTLGEIRSDVGTDGLPAGNVNPYAGVTALNLKDSFLRITFGNAAGSATADDVTNSTANSRFSTTAPITMSSSQINIDNASFSATSTNFYDYNVVQGLGVTTLTGGFNRIGFRSADAGTVTLTFANIVNTASPGTMLEFYIDSLSGAALGTGAKHRIVNTALEGLGNVPFLGGWAYSSGGNSATNSQEFVKYLDTTAGGFGYTPLAATDYAIDTAVGTWAAGQNIKVVGGSPTLAAGTTDIQSLNIQSTTARTLGGAAGAILNISSGGLLTGGGVTHTISVPFLTSSGGTLYIIAANTNIITSDVTGAINLVKGGTGTTSFLTGNSYTGTTFINEGQFRGVIGSGARALGTGNLTFGGSPTGQATYENDGDFTRALGTGVGQVQFLGGGGIGGGSTGFSAFGAPIDINFGGAGATVVWGSATFNPGIFTLNGGNATHVATLVNTLDLGGEQRYIRLDGNAAAGNRAVIGAITGDITNGSIVKRGGGILLIDNAKTYQNGTIISEGEIWLTKTGTLGANVTGNDIQIGSGARLLIEAPSNIGSRQLIILQNNDVTTPATISFGDGYGTGSEIVFNSFTATGGIPTGGGNNILIANNQSGQARRVAVTISGNNNFQADVIGQIRAVAPNVEAWFGADTANGTFTGATLSPSGGAVTSYRLGGHINNNSTLTIANENVLTGAFGVIVGAPSATAVNYTAGTIYLPRAQSFTGQVLIGNGGILQAGVNGSLGTGGLLNDTILLQAGELRLDAAKGTYGGQVGTQYAARNVSVSGGTGTIRTTSLLGAGYNDLRINDLTFDAGRTLQVLTLGTNFTNLVVNNINFANSANTITLAVGVDNSFQAGAGVMTVNGIIGDQATGAQSLTKSNGGVLILNSDNTYDGVTTITQGRLVLSNTGAAGVAGSTVSLTANSDRRADLEFRINGTGPFLFDNAVTTAGGNDNSTRVITVGAVSPGSEDQTVRISSLTIGHVGAYTVGGSGNSAIFFDGANGYRLEVTGAATLNRSISLRPRGAVLTLTGVVSGAAANALEKHDQGTLILNGNNTYLGTTTISSGYIIAGHDNAFGLATSDITFRNNVFSQILASGVRTIDRNFINTATGSIQTLGGLDAGAKLFSGNVNLSTRGVALTSFIGGDTTFSGVISGGFGVEKQGNGTVILSNANTYTGGTIVTQGTLIGNAQAAGSPFGPGAITVNDGEIRLVGQAASTTTTAGVLTVAGGARVGVDASAGGVTNFTFASLARTGSGTVTFVPTTGSLNTNEVFSFTAAPTLVNTIIGPWAVHAVSGANSAASYVTLSGNNVVTAIYGGTGSIDTVGGSTQVFDATGVGGTLTANRSVFALRTDTNINLGGFRLAVGDTATPANGGGIILNNGADIIGVAGSRINIENTALFLRVDDEALSELNVPIRNFRSNVNNTLTTVLTKFGAGELRIGAVQEFEGNIELNRGTLSFGAANVLPFFSNLAGTTGSILIMSPGTTVNLNGFDQEIGNISAVNPSNDFQFSAGTMILGGNTLTVGRENSNQTFNGRITGGAGSRLVKAGAGTLTLNNINGNNPSTLETLEITQGALAAWVNDNSFATPTTNAPAIPSTTTILLRGGQFTALGIGDSTSNQQRIAIGNNIVHQGADSILRTDRATGGGSNKLLTFGNLTLDVQRFLVNNANTFFARIDGTTTLSNHARLQTDNSFVIGGVITDGGKGYTLNKIGASDLSIGGASGAGWTGGLVITGGTVLFGTRGLDDVLTPGTTFVPLATANAGTGDIIVNLGSALRITAPSNITAGQEVRVYGSDNGSTTRVELLTDGLLTDYHLRSLTDGSIALGMSEGFWTSAIDLAKLGNGQWGLSAQSNTYYTATTLGESIDNRYIFNGTSAGVLTIANDNVVTGSASVVVAKSPIFAGATPAGSGASIRFAGDQDYTGNTTIFRASDTGTLAGILEITGDLASPVIDVYGRLTARGAGRFTDDAGAQVNTVVLRPGGNLRLDYNMNVADNFILPRLDNSNLGTEATENKWADGTALVLDGAGINLVSADGRVNQETVGAITIKGGTGITLERVNAGQIVLKTPSITRDGQATLAIRNTTAAELGSINIQSQKLIITGAAPTLTNGIVAPWMVNLTARSFLSYNADTGFINAPFAANAGVGGDAFFAGTTATTVAQYLAANSSPLGANTLTGTKDVYALRVDEFSGTVDNVFDGGQINIHSGGLILGSDDSNRVNFNTTAVFFGDGTDKVEGIVYGGHSTPNSRFGGKVSAANLTFDGPGGFQLTNLTNDITGTIQLNGGRLFLDGAGTQGTATEVILYSDYANNFNGNQFADLRLRHNSATTTFTGLTVTVAANVPYAQIQAERFTGAGTTTAVQFQNLNILGTNGPAGTLLRLNNSNSNTNVLGTTTIGSSSDVGMNVNANTWRLIGNITSAAEIVKTGDGTLRFDGANGTFTGGFTLNRGEWRLNGANANVGGTGDVELNFGTVRMADSPNNTAYFANPGQTISVNGQVTFINDRDGGATGRVRTIGANGSPSSNIFTTSNSPFIIFQSPGFGDAIVLESRLVINDSPTFRPDSSNLFLRDVVSGNGTFNMAGTNQVRFDNNVANTFSGGYNAIHGYTYVTQANATLGTGPVQLYAGAGLSIISTANLGTTGLTKILTSGTALPVIGTRTIANFNSVTAAVAAPGVISGTGNGMLAIDNGQTLIVDPSMATRNGGVFNLWNIGSQDGGTLSANSIAPWGVGGQEFRVGGGGSTLTLNPTTANAAQLALGTGGNKLIIGVANTIQGVGTVVIGANANNTYDGGTLVTRGRDRAGQYRGSALSLQGGADGVTTNFRTSLGSGTVHVNGEVRIEGASGTAVTTGGLTNANSWEFHGGSRLRFDNTTAFTGSGTTGNQATGTIGGGGRWADGTGISLFSTVIDMVGDNADTAANKEIVGDLTIGGGSEVVVRRVTGFGAELITSNVFRNGTGTLMLRHDTGLLGAAGSVNTDRFIVTSGAGATAGQVQVTNNMVDPWIVSRTENQFLKYDATRGFEVITAGGAPANYRTSAGGTIDGTLLTLNNGTEILDVGTAVATLGINADVWALRTDRSINPSLDSAFSRITIRSGGLMVGSNLTASINPDLYFGAAGNGTGEALIWATTGTLQINGKIFASQVTKSGTNFLNIQSDQPQFTGNWVINGGGVQFLTPNAQSTGEVIINGAHIADNDSAFNLNEVRYNFNSGTPDLFTWGGGKITVNDMGQIRTINGNDRLTQIPAVDLKTTGGGHEGLVIFQADSSRSTVRTGTVTLFDNYLISTDATSFGPGSTSGVQLGAGNGTGGLNNQGLYDVRLSGDGVLSLGDNSASFTGAHSISVGDGTVRVLHNGAFGAATATASLRSTGALEIAVANFAPIATVNQEVGSIERWAVNNARGDTGTYTLPNGVHLQVFTDISTPSARTIELSGGSIMGYLPLDYDQVAVIQTIREGVTVNLTADSFLGQIYPAGTSNGANSIIYDMGKLNTTTNLNPSDVGLRGSYLVIDGNITGNFDLTKVGQDVIKLAGANSFGDLSIEGGIIQTGRTNALAATTVVSTRGEGTAGILDIDGYHQTIGGLEGPSGSVNNSAFDLNVLTVNTTADHTYAGSINGSIELVKQGAAVQTLSGENTYSGITKVEAGELNVALGGTLTRTSAAQVDASALLRVNGAILSDAPVTVAGTLTGSGSIAGNVATSTGGTLAPGNNNPGTLDIGGTLSFAANSTFAVELAGGAPGDGAGFYDQVNAGGPISLNSAAVITLALTNGFDPNGAGPFFVLTQGGMTPFAGTFANASINDGVVDFGNGITAQITYDAHWTGLQGTSTLDGGNDVALFNVIPEPGSLVSLLGGMATLLGLHRSRRRSTPGAVKK